MQNLFFSCFFFLFSCATQQLVSSKTFLFHTHKNNNRRILHEPFVPLNTLSPSQPPKPPPQPKPKPPLPSYSSTSTSTSNTKHPFSTTITTPNNNNNNPNQDESPFFPNYPPSSPPPPSPITFASFPANISSLVIPHTTQPTSSSNKLLPITLIAVSIAVAVVFAIFTFVYFRRRYRNRRAADNKSLRSDSSLELFPRNDETVAVAGTGSEFLYLGTVVNSRRIDDTQRGGVLDSRKLESPELRPLPPLARFPEPPLPPPRGGGGTCSEEEDEEFYSPRGSSLGGLENSGGTGSCSQQAFSAIAARRSGESSSISCSSSSFGSPEHSHSISLSPPASSSPRRTDSKSPETTPSHSVSTFSSQQHVQSSSQERVLEKNEDALSARVSNASNGSVKSIISSSSAFSLPSSPEKITTMHHHSTFDQSPRISSVSEGLKIPGLSSMPLSPSLLSSPEIERGGFNYTSNYAATVPHRKLWEIPIAPVPPPPPPLPPQRQRRHWGMPASSIPVGQSQHVLRPPELVPPSRPFVLQNTTINEGLGEIEETSKLKLKPLHWDKVRTSSDREMAWDNLKSSSFK